MVGVSPNVYCVSVMKHLSSLIVCHALDFCKYFWVAPRRKFLNESTLIVSVQGGALSVSQQWCLSPIAMLLWNCMDMCDEARGKVNVFAGLYVHLCVNLPRVEEFMSLPRYPPPSSIL